jgi:hypothetical protein
MKEMQKQKDNQIEFLISKLISVAVTPSMPTQSPSTLEELATTSPYTTSEQKVLLSFTDRDGSFDLLELLWKKVI